MYKDKLRKTNSVNIFIKTKLSYTKISITDYTFWFVAIYHENYSTEIFLRFIKMINNYIYW